MSKVKCIIGHTKPKGIPGRFDRFIAGETYNTDDYEYELTAPNFKTVNIVDIDKPKTKKQKK